MSESDDDKDSNHRAILKIIRDATKTPYDLLPSGETIGSFANRHASERYRDKIEKKRVRAREIRKRRRPISKRKR